MTPHRKNPWKRGVGVCGRVIGAAAAFYLSAATQAGPAWAGEVPILYEGTGERTVGPGAKFIGTRRLVLKSTWRNPEYDIHLYVPRLTPQPKDRPISCTVVQGKGHKVHFVDESGARVGSRQGSNGRELWRLSSDQRYWMVDEATNERHAVTISGSAVTRGESTPERQKEARIKFAFEHGPMGGGTPDDRQRRARAVFVSRMKG